MQTLKRDKMESFFSRLSIGFIFLEMVFFIDNIVRNKF